MKQYPASYPERARELYIPGVYGYKQVALDLGVPASTVRRWVDPTAADRYRREARTRKQRYRGTCIDCGAPTAYNGVDTSGSKRCRSCRKAWEQSPEGRASVTKWTRQLIIERIREWDRLYGQPPNVHDWDPWRSRFQLGDELRAQRFLLADGHWPWFTSVVHAFGSWNAGIVAAGFEPNEPTGAAKRWNGERRRLM